MSPQKNRQKQRRSACNSCRLNKLRCERRPSRTNGACERCYRAGVSCITNAAICITESTATTSPRPNCEPSTATSNKNVFAISARRLSLIAPAPRKHQSPPPPQEQQMKSHHKATLDQPENSASSITVVADAVANTAVANATTNGEADQSITTLAPSPTVGFDESCFSLLEEDTENNPQGVNWQTMLGLSYDAQSFPMPPSVDLTSSSNITNSTTLYDFIPQPPNPSMDPDSSSNTITNQSRTIHYSQNSPATTMLSSHNNTLGTNNSTTTTTGTSEVAYDTVGRSSISHHGKKYPSADSIATADSICYSTSVSPHGDYNNNNTDTDDSLELLLELTRQLAVDYTSMATPNLPADGASNTIEVAIQCALTRSSHFCELLKSILDDSSSSSASTYSATSPNNNNSTEEIASSTAVAGDHTLLPTSFIMAYILLIRNWRKIFIHLHKILTSTSTSTHPIANTISSQGMNIVPSLQLGGFRVQGSYTTQVAVLCELSFDMIIQIETCLDIDVNRVSSANNPNLASRRRSNPMVHGSFATAIRELLLTEETRHLDPRASELERLPLSELASRLKAKLRECRDG